MYCSNCGNKIEADEMFCTVCGAKVVSDEEQPEPLAHDSEGVAEFPGYNGEANDLQPEADSAADTTVGNDFSDPSEFHQFSDEISDDSEIESENSTEDNGEAIPENVDYVEVVPANGGDDSDKIENVKKEKNKREPKRKLGIGLRILSVFLCIILFVFSFGTSMVGILRTFLSVDDIVDEATDLDFAEVKINGKSFAELIYEDCSKEVIDFYGITEDAIEDILEEIDFDNSIRKIFEPSLEYIIGERDELDEQKILDEIIRLYNDNIDIIADRLSVEIRNNEAYWDYYSEYFGNGTNGLRNALELQDSTIASIELKISQLVSDIDDARFENKQAFELLNAFVRSVEEPFIYICLIVICALLAGLVVIVNKLRILRIMRCFGVISIANGLLFAAICGVYFLAKTFVTSVPSFVFDLSEPFGEGAIVRMIAYLAFGIIVCTATSIVSGVIKRKKM